MYTVKSKSPLKRFLKYITLKWSVYPRKLVRECLKINFTIINIYRRKVL